MLVWLLQALRPEMIVAIVVVSSIYPSDSWDNARR